MDSHFILAYTLFHQHTFISNIIHTQKAITYLYKCAICENSTNIRQKNDNGIWPQNAVACKIVKNVWVYHFINGSHFYGWI